MNEEHPNRVKLDAAPYLRILTIDGYKFFEGKDYTFQCATCLNVMGLNLHDDPLEKAKEEKRVRKIIIQKDCDCECQV